MQPSATRQAATDSSTSATTATTGTTPVAAVDGVGVRADHTRRGVLTMMMGEQLRDCVRRGDLLASLHASESTIYGRFGYGAATRRHRVRIRKAEARFRSDAPAGGRVRLLDADEAVERIPWLYRRIGPHRPGMMTRPEIWWPGFHNYRFGPKGDYLAAVHTGPEGDDAFVVYRTVHLRTFDAPGLGAVVEVQDLHAASPSALAGLWRFLLAIDLVSEVRAPARPVDEPVGAMLVEPRAYDVTSLWDDTWLRLLDVPAALAARSYRQAEPVVIELVDEQLPENSGAYRISPEGAARTDEPPQLRLDAETLAMIYLGEWAPSTLAEAGRLEVITPSALTHADDLFRTPSPPWCGTYF